jgi:hypothetical protein
LLLALVLRLAWLGHDPPVDLESNSPAQDAFWYLEAAQAPADGSRVESLPSFDRPLWTGVARAWFALAGTGIESDQALAALFGTLSVLGVALALRERPRAALLGSLLLATSYPFVGLARTPLIYTPLAALGALVFALHTREGLASRALAWLLLLVVVGAFKGVALALAPGLALADLVRPRRGMRQGAWAGLALALLLLALLGVLVTLRLDPGELERNRLRLEAYVAADLSLGSWRRLVLAPTASGLVPLAPGLLGLAAVGATRWRVRERAGLAASPVVLGALGWVGSLFLGLALSDYRPLRFYALAGPPLAILAGVGADALLRAGFPPSGAPPVGASGARTRPAPLAAGVVAANALASLAALPLAVRALPALVRSELAALAAPLGVGAALLVLVRPLAGLFGSLPAARRLGLIVIALTLGLDLARDLAAPPATILEAGRVVREALGPGAVLVGPYASGLAAGTKGLERRRAPALYGGPNADRGLALAHREGFTHVALDEEQDHVGDLSGGFARLGEAPTLVLRLQVRHAAVLVYRLRSAEGAGYRLSPFEAACEAPDTAAALRAIGAPRELYVARVNALRFLGRQSEANALLAAASSAN